MADRKKVINGLEELYGFLFKEYANVPAEESKKYYERICAIRDALAVLEEQEPKTILDIADPIEGIEIGKCPRCDRTILNKQSDPTWFCKYCGQAVKFK